MVGLERRMARLLVSNSVLSGRMRQLNAFAGRASDEDSLLHHTPPVHNTVRLQQRPKPTASPASSLSDRNHIATCSGDEVATKTRIRPLTPLSGCTLAEVPVLSIIPLPITTNELYDGGQVYTSTYAQRVARDLGDMMQCQDGQGTARPLGLALHRINAINDTGCNTDTSTENNRNEGYASVPLNPPPLMKQLLLRKLRVKWRV